MNTSLLERYIRDFTGNLFAATNSDELYQRTLSLVGKYFNASFISILLIEETEDDFYIDFSNCISVDYCQKPYSVFQTDVVKRCYASGAPIYLEKEENGSFCEVGGEFFTSIDCCFPIFFGGQMIGFLLFQDEDNVYDFQDEDNRDFVLEFLEILSSAIVSMKRIEAERDSGSVDAAKLNGLNMLCDLVQIENVEEIYIQAMQEIMEELKGEVGSVQSVKKKKAESIVEMGLPDFILQQISLEDGTPITEKVIKDKEAFYSLVDRIRIPLSIADENVSVSSLAVIPLSVNNQIVGLINVVNYSEDLTLEKVQELEIAANYASLALSIRKKGKGKVSAPSPEFFQLLRDFL